MQEQKEKLSPEAVVEILKKKGTIVTVDQAASILKFMRMLADIAVNEYLREPKT